MEYNSELHPYKAELATKSVERLSCIVCHERMSKPLSFCLVGHLCCQECQSNLLNCPYCSREFCANSNIALEQMLEISIFPCKNKIYGCKIIAEYEVINSHEELRCDYQQIKCSLTVKPNLMDITHGDGEIVAATETPCNAVITLCHFKEHIRNHHFTREIINIDKKLQKDLNVDLSQNFKRIQVIEVVEEKNQDDTLFFLENMSYDIGTKMLCVGYHFVGLLKDAQKYKYTVMIKGGRHSVVNGQNRCLEVGKPAKYDLNSCKCVQIGLNTFMSQNCTSKLLELSVQINYADLKKLYPAWPNFFTANQNNFKNLLDEIKEIRDKKRNDSKDRNSTED